MPGSNDILWKQALIRGSIEAKLKPVCIIPEALARKPEAFVKDCSRSWHVECAGHYCTFPVQAICAQPSLLPYNLKALYSNAPSLPPTCRYRMDRCCKIPVSDSVIGGSLLEDATSVNALHDVSVHGSYMHVCSYMPEICAA